MTKEFDTEREEERKVDLNDNIPIYDVVEQNTYEVGLYKKYETHIVIDAPFDIFMNNDKICLMGLNDEVNNPIFLKFYSATQKVIDGKIYTVLIKETYYEEN